jgi:hypothetical protein
MCVCGAETKVDEKTVQKTVVFSIEILSQNLLFRTEKALDNLGYGTCDSLYSKRTLPELNCTMLALHYRGKI